MANPILLKRGTAASLAALAAVNGLKSGEPYFITDQGRFALGLTASTYQTFAKLTEATSDPAKADLNGNATQAFAASQLQIGPVATALIISQGLTNNQTNIFISRDGTTTSAALTNNVAMGYQAFKNGTGSYNTMFGSQAGVSTGTGANNVGIGFAALGTATGSNNVGIGIGSLGAASGLSNVAIGSQSGASTTGSYNVFIGDGVGINNTTGSTNTLIGTGASAPTITSNGIISIAGGNIPRARWDGTGWSFSGVVTSFNGFSSTAGDYGFKTILQLTDADYSVSASLLKDYIFRITPTVTRTVSLPAAADIIATLTGYQVGSHFEFSLCVESPTVAVTLATAVGLTLAVPTTTLTYGWYTFRGVITSASSVTLLLKSGPMPQQTVGIALGGTGTTTGLATVALLGGLSTQSFQAKDFTSSSGYMNLKANTALPDAAATLSAVTLKQGLFTITPTVARLLTTDTAVNIVASLAGYQVGSHYDFSITNNAAFDVTLAAGVGVTLAGKSVVNNGSGLWCVVVTSATTVSIYALSVIAASSGGTATTDASLLTTGTLAVARGGTGTTDGLVSRALLAGSLTQPFSANTLSARLTASHSVMLINQGANAASLNNTALGAGALTSTAVGDDNTALGFSAGGTTTGGSNTYIGSRAGASAGGATACVGIGLSALSGATGAGQIGIGNSVLLNSSGTNNVGIGLSALSGVTTGSSNTALGYQAGLGILTGSNNLLLGDGITGLPASLTNNIILATAGVIRVQFDGASWTFNARVSAAAGFASSSGDVNLKAATTLSDANATLTAAQMKQGMFTINPTAPRTLTLDTAANIIAGMSGYQVGSHYSFAVLNLSAFLVTMAPGVGVTWVGKVAINACAGSFRIVVTSAATVTIYTEGSDGVAGVSGDVQYNLNGVQAAAANTEIDNGDLVLVATTTPTTPLTDRLKLFNKKSANRAMLAMVGPSGSDMRLQPHFGTNKIATYIPQGNSTTVTSTGYNASTILGSTTTRTMATTNLFTRARRLGFVSATASASFAGNYLTVTPITTGVTIGGILTGGFYKVVRFGISDPAAVSGSQMFIGVSALIAAPTNAEPNTLTNCVGVGHGSADTNLKIFFGGSAAQAPIDLGAGFPLTVNSAVLYELALFCPAGDLGANVVNWQVTNLSTNVTASGTLTAATAGTQLPLNTTLLSYARHYRTNNATALAVGLDIVGDYIDTNN